MLGGQTRNQVQLAALLHHLDAGVEVLRRAFGGGGGVALRAQLPQRGVLRPLRRQGGGALHVGRLALGQERLIRQNGRQATGRHEGHALRPPRGGVVGAVLQRQTDLVLVDGLPDLGAVAGGPVVVEAAQVDVDLIQVPLLGGGDRK